ncbi:hypothetical protein [Parvibaculum sp.]|uniref:hypothetical protein n=1 Tax=Parvibaculum sp. TaxID=2024848 RepID=UPI00320ED2F3
MFYRYALHIREGLGVAWNPDGLPTYGMTSQLWVFFVLPFTFLPLSAGDALRLASSLTGLGALAVMSFTLWRYAHSAVLRFFPISLLTVSLPLLAAPQFAFHMITGMDTMLSLLTNAALVFGILEYSERPRSRQAFVVGLLAFVAVLARPDNAVCALATPFFIWATLPGTKRWGDLFHLVVLPLGLIGIELMVCRWYFGVALPLSFYAKLVRTYEGFQSSENAVEYFFYFVILTLPFVGILCANLRRSEILKVAAFLLPAAVTFLYLLTARQIMGTRGRFYVPFLPFLVVPALLSADMALMHDARRALARTSIAILAVVLLYVGARPLRTSASDAYIRSVRSAPILVPAFTPDTRDKLADHASYQQVIETMGVVLAQLPQGVSVAASEVGYIGSSAPHIPIIDLVGLNDTHIGTHGFSMDDLLLRAPDLIWFPHTDYTGMRRRMFAEPRLLDRYVVVDGAFRYGIAIRKDSPYRPQIEAALRKGWAVLYPSRVMDDYIVAR